MATQAIATFSGNVVHGFGRGSKLLGCPTANLDCEVDSSFKTGVYAGTATLNGTSYKAAINIGVSPHFSDRKVSIVEVHLIAYDGNDFYGEGLAVTCTSFIRPEASYSSTEELKRQISADILVASAC